LSDENTTGANGGKGGTIGLGGANGLGGAYGGNKGDDDDNCTKGELGTGGGNGGGLGFIDSINVNINVLNIILFYETQKSVNRNTFLHI
tara:strand:- start:1102 stop:1368 length:267 start_codon:yes stop_codon:yes gene_type:complete